jgi:hypothetical protein
MSDRIGGSDQTIPENRMDIMGGQMTGKDITI